MSTVYTYDYARSILERAFIEAGQFAHVAEADIIKAFDDVENNAVPDFEYSYPVHPQREPRYDLYKPITWTWECRFSKARYQRGEDVWFGFFAAPMSILLRHRHGCLCGLCMNPTAKYRVRGLRMARELRIGRNGDESERLPNACEGCLGAAMLDTWFTEEQFVSYIQKQLRKPNSPLMDRLRSAPRLRFEPRRA